MYDMMETTLAERGQIVIPKVARDGLGWRSGMKLEVRVEGNQIVLQKRVKLNLDRWIGSVDNGLTIQQEMDDLRNRNVI